MAWGGRILFEGVNVSFQPNHRYGLTGPNGSGKSTFLKIIRREEEPTTGSISLPRKTGFLRQNIEDFREQKVRDVVVMGNERLWEALEERDALYLGEMNDAVGLRLGELEGILAEEDYYSADANAEILLHGIGIPASSYDKKMAELPTDHQFRVLLCQAIFGEPEALLLDEPTNHLDLSSITWLQEFLLNYTGTLVVISHDRHFLNAVTTDIADIDYETIILYPGNYDEMVEAKLQARDRAEHEAKSKHQKIEKLQEFVNKFRSGTRASQVKSRQREIQRLQPQELKKSNIQRPYIRFPTPDKTSGQVVLRAKKLRKSFHDNLVIDRFSLEVARGDKIAIIGNNGRGKTTLLKLLAQELEADEGEVRYGHEVDIGIFPQNHHERVHRTIGVSLIDWLRQRKENVFEQDIRGALGKLLFSGDDAFKEVAHLSGGETARLILADLMLHSHNTLILDEPNNHLDLEAVSALAWGLEQFEGTLLFASHDRDLLASVATRIISLTEEGIELFEGTFEEYYSQKKS